MAGRMINGAAALAELIKPAGDTGDFGTHRVLPVLPELSSLLPSRGLRRGTTIAIGITPGPSVHQGALPAPSPPSAGPHESEASGRAARRGSSRSAPGPHEEVTNWPGGRAPEIDDVGSGPTNRPDESGPAIDDAGIGPGSRGPEIDGAGSGFTAGPGGGGSATDGAGSGFAAGPGGGGFATDGVGGGSADRPGATEAATGGPFSNESATRGSAKAPARRAGWPATSPSTAGSAADRSSSLRSAPPISDATIRGGGAVQPGGGSTSLLLALLAAASNAGSWCAVVGVPTLGALAAAESGIALDRLALVPDPGPEWPTVVAALIDGVDVVVVAVPGRVSASITSRLVARARQRGCVLVPYGRWDGADVTLQVTQGRWEGLGAGHGRLRRRKVTVVARGRGTAARPKEITMWMPGLAVAPPPDPTPGTRSRPTAVPPAPATDHPASAPATDRAALARVTDRAAPDRVTDRAAATEHASSVAASRAEGRAAGSGRTRSGSGLLASVTPILSVASDPVEEAPLDDDTSRENMRRAAGAGYA
jgi:hypothetical protein